MRAHTDPYNRSTELMFWMILNLIAVGVCTLATGGMGSIEGESLFDQIAVVGWILLVLGGPLFIALLQWISNRCMKISRLGIFWVVTGFASSLLALIIVGISILDLGNYPTQTDYFFFAILVVSEHYVILGFVQGIWWWLREKGNARRALLWVVIHAIGFTIVVFIAYHLIYTFSFNIFLAIASSLVLMAILFSISGMVLLQAREQEIMAGSA